jgi:hypothetical protein
MRQFRYFQPCSAFSGSLSPLLLKNAADYGIWTWQRIGSEESVQRECIRFADILKDAGETSPFLIARIDQGCDKRLLNVDLISFGYILELFKQLQQRQRMAQSFNMILA